VRHLTGKKMTATIPITAAVYQPASPILGVRLPPDVKAWVEQQAARAGMSASVYVRNLIERERAEAEEGGR